MFQPYKPRQISFLENEQCGAWTVKVYTITHLSDFSSTEALKAAYHKLPQWLQEAEVSEWPVYNMAFLVLHEGRDGVWALLNWWTGGEMLRTLTYYTGLEGTIDFQHAPKVGSMACVWEMQVIQHEREAWMQHVLKQAENPNFKGYITDLISGRL